MFSKMCSSLVILGMEWEGAGSVELESIISSIISFMRFYVNYGTSSLISLNS